MQGLEAAVKPSSRYRSAAVGAAWSSTLPTPTSPHHSISARIAARAKPRRRQDATVPTHWT